MKTYFYCYLSFFFLSKSSLAQENFQFSALDLTEHNSQHEAPMFLAGININKGVLTRVKIKQDVPSSHDLKKHSLYTTGQRTLLNTLFITSLVHTLSTQPIDKQRHFLVGSLVGGGVSYWAKHYYFKGDKYANNKAFWAGVAASALVGLLKESADYAGAGAVDRNDAIYTAVPGVIMSLLALDIEID